MQMNVLRTKQVSHVGSRDDHGQPIAGGNGTAPVNCAQGRTKNTTMWVGPVQSGGPFYAVESICSTSNSNSIQEALILTYSSTACLPSPPKIPDPPTR